MFRTHTLSYVRSVLVLVVVLAFSGVLPQTTPTALAQGPFIELVVSGPSYVTPGNNITYKLTLQNVTTGTITGIEVTDPIPAGTTYVSGGTFNAGLNRAEFTLASLAANAKQTFTLEVRAGIGTAIGTRIENTGIEASYTVGSSGYTSSGFDGVVTTVEAAGVRVASYKNAQARAFDVVVDGYGFQNYGQTSHEANDLGADDVFLMFGQAACTSGTTAATCVLSKPADDWRKKQLEYMQGGHCDGLAMTSLRFFNQRAFKGKTTPGNHQPGAARTNDLGFPLQSVENYIAYYWTTQTVDSNRVYGSPVAIVNKLINDFNQTPGIGYAVHIYKLPDFEGGHSIAAYGVENVGSNVSRILVYDNNFPNQRQYITVDKQANTWRYETAATPGEPPDLYTGTATSENMILSPLSTRDLPAGQYFECPFCPDPAASLGGTGLNQVSGEVHFQFTGEGSLLVVNDEGQSTGDDFNTTTFTNTIPGAEVEHHLGGLGKQIPPRIIVPFTEHDDTYYTAYVHGKTHDSATNGSLMIVGAGFSIGVDDLDLDPDELFEFRLSPDGDHISFKSTETITAPNIYIAHDPIHAGDPSIVFDVAGVTVHAGETISLDLDPALERIHFIDTGAQDEHFDVGMDVVWPDGDTKVYTESIHIPAGANSAFIDFGAWDGLQHPATYIDNVLQNPSANHRLKLAHTTGSYDATPRANAPAGVYTVRATFTNVTEVSLGQVYFSVANLGTGNVLLNAQGGPAGVGAKIQVPASALGADGLLHSNESFTLSFQVGLAQAGTSGLTIDANGVPHDWIHPNPAPPYNANNTSFVFPVQSRNNILLPRIAR